ncbi:TPA_asm: hypothetical protein, partial [Stylophora coral adintovirus]
QVYQHCTILPINFGLQVSLKVFVQYLTPPSRVHFLTRQGHFLVSLLLRLPLRSILTSILIKVLSTTSTTKISRTRFRATKILVTQQGKGHTKRKYTQKKRNAYKVDIVDGQYGGLLINPNRLINEMVVEAINPSTGSLVYERHGDKSLVDLLTKRFNPKKNYSPLAVQIFRDLNKLANLPMHKSSGKAKLGGAIFSDFKDLKDRLIKLSGSIDAGNSSIQLRNEAIEILDHLLKNNKISKKQYSEYIQDHLT